MLDRNQLTTLPESFGFLTVGGDLNLNENPLTMLPDSFDNLTVGLTLRLDDDVREKSQRNKECQKLLQELLEIMRLKNEELSEENMRLKKQLTEKSKSPKTNAFPATNYPEKSSKKGLKSLKKCKYNRKTKRCGRSKNHTEDNDLCEEGKGNICRKKST